MDGIKLLQKLIRIPSYSGREDKLAGFLVDYCSKFHLPVDLRNGNVIIYLKGTDKSKVVIFNAHLDTVNSGNILKWKYPPTGKNAGKIEAGKLFGLGASDCKGAIVSMMLVAKKLVNPPCDVWFTFVSREETDGFGTENFIKRFIKQKQFPHYKDTVAVIGEPTCLNTIEIGHRGNIFAQVTVCGDSGHSAVKYQEDKLVIMKAVKIMELINRKFSKWEKIYDDKVLGSPSVNFTQISTDSSSVNKLPDRCIIKMDIRTTPKFHGFVDKLLSEAIGKMGVITYERGKTPPGLISPDHDVIYKLRKLLPNIRLDVSLGSTDQALFLRAGIPSVVIGPGCKEAMHKENEYIHIDNIRKASVLYHKFIFSFAGSNKTGE